MSKINFVYSNIYDQHYDYRIEYNKLMKYMKELEKKWIKIEKDITKELSKITELKWHEKEIKCYIVGKAIPFSDPLTIPYYKNINDGIDILIHELIHQIFTQGNNLEKSNNSWKRIYKKYKNESNNTKIHIPLQAIHKHIYLKFFNKNRLQKDIKSYQELIDYKRAWDIVEEEGYMDIINDFKKDKK